MILILSNSVCSITSNVIDVLISKHIKFLRINAEERIEILELDLYNSVFRYKNQVYSNNDFSAIWFYQGQFNFKFLIEENTVISEYLEEIKSHLSSEIKQIEYLFVNTFKGKVLGNYFTPNSNKIKSLRIANNIGLNIPRTKIITQRKQLEDAIKNTNIITKGIQDSATIEYLNVEKNELQVYNNYSSMVKKADIVNIPDLFFPTQIQTYIDKQYELRVFYLNKKCYTIAIFSQRNEKTKVDFRHYDDENENKQVPFCLPLDIEEKIIILMDNMELNTGSIDLIVDRKGEYVFLEINPVGLFEVVDYYGNYNLYEKIANFLI